MKTNYILAILAIIFGITAAFTNHSARTGLYPAWKYENQRVEGKKVHFISAHYVAELIYNKEQGIKILDVRSEEAYQKYHIPTSLLHTDETVGQENKQKGITILYGSADDPEVYQLAGSMEGKIYVIKGGIEQWYDLVLFPDFLKLQVRNSTKLQEIQSRCLYFGGTPRNSQLLNISVRESSFREGC